MRPSYGDFILEQERKERKKKRLVIFSIVLILLLIVAVTAVILLWKKDIFSFISKDAMAEVEETEQITYYTQEELDAYVADAMQAGREEGSAEALANIKQYLAEGKSAVEAFRIV